MPDREYENLDLPVERALDAGYRVRVLGGPAGEATAVSPWELPEDHVDSFLYRVGRPRQRTRRTGNPHLDEAKRFGAQLFDAVFRGDVLVNLERSLADTAARGVGLRVRLRLADAPELADLPWEFLFSRPRNQFLCLSPHTPVVRYLDLPERIKPQPVAPPLKLLAVISSPSDHLGLDVQREWHHLREALGPLVERRLVEIVRLETAGFGALTRRLSRDAFHVLHFVGHGEFDEKAQGGELVFEDERGKGRNVAADQIATVLNSHRSLRLVVLNSCEGARASRTDPFAGTAQALVRQGVPAVVAMQFEITDDAAITLAAEFYASVAVGRPIDASLADARRAIYAEGNGIEWATPVLYLRAPDGRIFDVERTPGVQDQSASGETERALREAADLEVRLTTERAAARQRAEEQARLRAEDTARDPAARDEQTERERAERQRAEEEGERQRAEAAAARERAEREVRSLAEEARDRDRAEQAASRQRAVEEARHGGQQEVRREAEPERRYGASAARPSQAAADHNGPQGAESPDPERATFPTKSSPREQGRHRYGRLGSLIEGRASTWFIVKSFLLTVSIVVLPVAVFGFGKYLEESLETLRRDVKSLWRETSISREAPYDPTLLDTFVENSNGGVSPTYWTPDDKSWRDVATCQALLNENWASWSAKYFKVPLTRTYSVVVHTMPPEAGSPDDPSATYAIRGDFRKRFPSLQFQPLRQALPGGGAPRWTIVVAGGIPPDRLDDARNVCKIARACIEADAHVLQRDGPNVGC